jgi:hypothetical protein
MKIQHTRNESIDPNIVSGLLERGKGSNLSGAARNAAVSSDSHSCTSGDDFDDISHVGELSAERRPLGLGKTVKYLAQYVPAVLRRAW